MLISCLPDTSSFDKTREWSEVRNAVTSLGEHAAVMKIPTAFAGDIGIFDKSRCLISQDLESASNAASFLSTNNIQCIISKSKISSSDYVYDWRSNTLWVNSAFESIKSFFNKTNTEVVHISTELPLRNGIAIGLNGDCVMCRAKLTEEAIDVFSKRYFCVDINDDDDVGDLILTNDGFVYDAAKVSGSNMRILLDSYKRSVGISLDNLNVRLHKIMVPLIG